MLDLIRRPGSTDRAEIHESPLVKNKKRTDLEQTTISFGVYSRLS
jgi:hypothetical protein